MRAQLYFPIPEIVKQILLGSRFSLKWNKTPTIFLKNI
jgi:hypothetical protein